MFPKYLFFEPTHTLNLFKCKNVKKISLVFMQPHVYLSCKLYKLFLCLHTIKFPIQINLAQTLSNFLVCVMIFHKRREFRNFQKIRESFTLATTRRKPQKLTKNLAEICCPDFCSSSSHSSGLSSLQTNQIILNNRIQK
jgi:hypothetical protein